jgi:ABC-type Fe3+/spermidine/putrescine transport system ATPase subunit
MRMLATIATPTEGVILWNGRDAAKEPEALRPVSHNLDDVYLAAVRLGSTA